MSGCLGSSGTESSAPSLGQEAVSLLNGGTFVTSLSCPCCHGYADILRGRGVDTLEIVEQENYTEPKQRAGIPRKLWACHTITTEDYVLEGHLPLEAVEKVATERPSITGIALPGMPAGSPGMGGTADGEFIVYAIEQDGSTSEYVRV
ncbi:DUF411 domain-containing protein [Halolamina sp. C58]|uniref:DUF411 domain-containing protein n=1 Tax=Halolamina sp. C58 TaxID=3421640 RepID=UPI003EB91363